MQLKRHYRSMILALTALIFASLACNMPRGAENEPIDAAPIPVTTEAVATLAENLEAAATEVHQSKVVTIEVSEEQLTSLVALELANQEDPVFQDPQIYLRDDQIQVNGKVQQNGLNAPLTMILTASVDEQGMPQYTVVSAKLGPIPLPQNILDQLTTQLDRAFTDYFHSETNNILLEDISIANGFMTVTGRTP